MHATVLIDGAEGESAREIISRFMEFSLERDGDEVRLVSVFDVEGLNWRGRSGSIALEIVVPKGMELDIRDGSGSMRIVDTQADVRVEDGAGSLEVRHVGGVDVKDGSGSIRIRDAWGDARIRDGSGSVTVARVAGSVVVEDRSGSIREEDVDGDFRVTGDGSGSVGFANVLGRVDVPE